MLRYTIVLCIALYVLFAVLPFGVRTQGEAGETVPGTPSSAPSSFPFVRMFLINTAVAIVVFCCIWVAIEFDFFGISDFANKVHR